MLSIYLIMSPPTQSPETQILSFTAVKKRSLYSRIKNDDLIIVHLFTMCTISATLDILLLNS